MDTTYFALIIGIVATTQIHLAKGMQRYGIEGFRKRQDPSMTHIKRRRIVYIIGILLNNVAFLWALLANTYAPTAYYTSMFGFGLVVLMFFSEIVLHEEISKLQHLGAMVIALGTAFFGFGKGRGEPPPLQDLQPEEVLLYGGIYFGVVLTILLISMKIDAKRLVGIFTGLFTGGSAAMDPIFKGIGQAYGDAVKLIPYSTGGWVYFGGSFIFGFFAFSFTQLGFYKRARASTILVFHNASIILVPVVIMQLALPGYDLTLLQLTGLLTITAGIVLMYTERTLLMFNKFLDDQRLKRSFKKERNSE
jgi:hypothetical protein